MAKKPDAKEFAEHLFKNVERHVLGIILPLKKDVLQLQEQSLKPKSDGASFDAEIRTAIEPLKQKIAALEQELAEAKGSKVPYCGAYREGTASLKGHFYTFGGSVWHCNSDTTSKPNEAHTEWTLAVKRGRDAR